MGIKIKYLLFIFFLSALFPAQAQMAMGSWKTYFSYYNATELTQSPDLTYAISEGNLFSVSKKQGDINTYSKINSLNDGIIDHIAYSKDNNLLFIAYQNSNIDLLKEGSRTINISDLKRKDIKNKEINDISFYQKFAYLSCGFGIVVVNLQKNEIADTYIIGNNGAYSNVNTVQVVENKIYALMDGNVILYADMSNTNLSNFENWHSLDVPDPDSKILTMAAFGSELIVLKENSILQFNGTDWNKIPDVYYTNIKYSDDYIIFYNGNEFLHWDKNKNEIRHKSLSGLADIDYSASDDSYWAILNDAENSQAILNKISYANEDAPVFSQFIPDGPYSSNVAFIKYRSGKIITGSGGPRDFPETQPGVIQILENNQWTVIRQKDLPPDFLSAIDNRFNSILDAEIDPKDPRRMYVASWRSLFEFYDNVLVEHYNPTNSSLTNTSTDINRVLLDGLCFDKNNNLWMLNMLCQNMVNIKKSDNTWTSLYYPEIAGVETVKEFFISKNGYKWVVFPRPGSAGLFVINDNGTPFDTKNDRTRFFSSFSESTSTGLNTITPSIFRCIAEDKNNVIWIGTDLGPLLISNQQNVFDSNFTIDRIKITREDDQSLADYLLSTERINAIVVDGGNRKWIGTASSGAYLLSPNGQQTIYHFTTENSPLISDNIIDIALNDETGEVFIATDAGLFTFKGDATTGMDSYSNVYAYPNPVYETFNGQITIKGLMENSVVKIADIQGHLIYQGYSNGGTFTWNGKNRSGSKVPTGIYLVFASLNDGSEKMVTKIAFIK